MTPRQVERRASMVASALGIASVLAVLFAPIYPATIAYGDGRPEVHTMIGLVVMPGGCCVPLPWFVLAPFLLAVILSMLIGMGGLLHTGRGVASARWLLWGATAGLLLLLIFFGGYGVRVFLLPSLLLAGAASIAAQRAVQPDTPAAPAA